MIESTENKKIKQIKKLNTQTKFRKKEKQFIVENKQSILDIIAKNTKLIDYVVVTDSHSEIKTAAKKKQVNLYICNQACAKYMSSVKVPMGCFAVIKQPELTIIKQRSSLVIALYQIKSPANCGAIIRNAHAFGCDAIYLLGDCCDPFHPESIRAAAGNITNIPIIDNVGLNQLSSYQCWKLDINASIPLNDVPKEERVCFILGSESGFGDNALQEIKSCYIPMKHQTDSLNVAATSAIALYNYMR